MKKLILITVCSVFVSICIGQTRKNNIEQEKVKKTIINFLRWYKQYEYGPPPVEKVDTAGTHKSIIVREQVDTLIRPSIDMIAVEAYLDGLRSSGYLSETYMNNMRQYHQKIANELKAYPPYPKSDEQFAIPGLNLDVVFSSFEPEAVLDRYESGIFKRIVIVENKSIVQFYIPRSSTHDYEKMLFTLTKANGKWLIDDIGYYHQFE